MKKKDRGYIIAAIVVLVILATAAIVLGVLSSWYTNWDTSTWFGGEEEENIDLNDNKPLESGVINEYGEELISGHRYALPSAMTFLSETQSSELSDEGVIVTATITPDDAVDKTVDWSLSFTNPDSEWASGKVVTDYVTVTPESDGALAATVKCEQAFGEQIILTVTSRAVPEVTSSCTIDYLSRITSFTLTSEYYGTQYGGFNDNTDISWEFFGDNPATALELPEFKVNDSDISNYELCFRLSDISFDCGIGSVVPDSEDFSFDFYVKLDDQIESSLNSSGFQVRKDNLDQDGFYRTGGGTGNGSFLGPNNFFLLKNSQYDVLGWDSYYDAVITALKSNGGHVGQFRCVMTYGDNLSITQTCEVGISPFFLGLIAEEVTLSDSSIVF